MATLRQNPTLSDVQKFVAELEKERNTTSQDVLRKCLHLGEEMGELFRLIRKNEKGPAVEDEIADVLNKVCGIANRLEINLENAFKTKMERPKS